MNDINKVYKIVNYLLGKEKSDELEDDFSEAMNKIEQRIKQLERIDIFRLAEEIQRWISKQKYDNENILHACVCCDHVGRIRFIKEIEKIIKNHIKTENKNGFM